MLGVHGGARGSTNLSPAASMVRCSSRSLLEASWLRVGVEVRVGVRVRVSVGVGVGLRLRLRLRVKGN